MADGQDSNGASAGLNPATEGVSPVDKGNHFSMKFPAPFMRRMFLPIGQGAFYCERFYLAWSYKPITMVYDCGAVHLAGKVWSKALQTNFSALMARHFPEGLKTIHALFISHFDSDHINGLELLRQHGVEIKQFFLPGIEKDDRWLMDLWFESMDPEGIARDVFQNPDILVSMFPGASVNIVQPSFPPQDSDVSETPETVKLVELNAEFMTTPFKDWVFSPFNYRRADYIDKLLDELSKELNLPKTLSNKELREHWERNGALSIDMMKGVFSRVLPKHGSGTKFNTNSMTVFSGPQNHHEGELQQSLVDCGQDSCLWASSLQALAPGGLFTGDYNATDFMQALTAFYGTRWNDIGCVQIPHHGSIRGFHKGFLGLDAIFVASAAFNHRYGHPSQSVEGHFQPPKHLFCVTEKADSCLCSLVREPNSSGIIPTCGMGLHTLNHLANVLGSKKKSSFAQG